MKTKVLSTYIPKNITISVMVAAMFFGMLGFTQPAAAFGSGIVYQTSQSSRSADQSAVASMSREELIALIQQLLQQMLDRNEAQGTTAQSALSSSSSTSFGEAENDIATFGNVRVRNAAGLSTQTVKVVPDGTKGKIIEGPLERDGYRWWKINYVGNVTGWSAENSLVRIEASEETTVAEDGTDQVGNTAGNVFTLNDVASVTSTFTQTSNGEGYSIYTITRTSGETHSVKVVGGETNVAAQFAEVGYDGDYLQLMFMAIRANTATQSTSSDGNSATRSTVPDGRSVWR